MKLLKNRHVVKVVRKMSVIFKGLIGDIFKELKQKKNKKTQPTWKTIYSKNILQKFIFRHMKIICHNWIVPKVLKEKYQ